MVGEWVLVKTLRTGSQGDRHSENKGGVFYQICRV